MEIKRILNEWKKDYFLNVYINNIYDIYFTYNSDFKDEFHISLGALLPCLRD